MKGTCLHSACQIHVRNQEAELFLIWESQQKKRKEVEIPGHKRTEIKKNKIQKSLKTRLSD